MVLKPGMICWDLTMGVGGQMNCQDGKCVYLKPSVVEKCSYWKTYERSNFFFSFLTFFFHSQARETVFRFTTAGGSGPRCNKLKHLMPESYGWKVDRIFWPVFS